MFKSVDIQVDDTLYHVERQGELADGVPLVLLHGFTGCAQNWRGLGGSCAGHGVATVAVDLLGHGQTCAPVDPQWYAMGAAAKGLADLLQSLGLDRVHLLGYSMGGRLALYMASHYPELIATLTLESASPGLAGADERATRKASDDTLAEWIEANGIPAFVDRWERVPLFESQKQLPQNVRSGLREQRLQNSAHGLANSLSGMGTGVQPSLWARLDSLAMPVQLIVGALDKKFVGINRRMHEQLSNATLTVVADAGHTIHLEKAAEFDELIIDWLCTHNLKK